MPEYFLLNPAALYNLYGSILVILGAGYMLVRPKNASPLGCYVCVCGAVIQCRTAYITGDTFMLVMMSLVGLGFVYQAWMRMKLEDMLEEIEVLKQQRPDIFK